jgi:hypothetical protein
MYYRDQQMPKQLTSVRLDGEDLAYLEKWIARENKKAQGPPWTIAYLLQRAVKDLIKRQKSGEEKS